MSNGPATSAASSDLPGYGHLRCLLSPAIALGFFVLQPQHWGLVLGFVAVTFVIDGAAEFSPEEQRQPAAGREGWPFDALLYAVFVLHWANLLLAARMVRDADSLILQAPAAQLMLLLSSGIAAMAAHELIHRARAREKWMGRLIFVGVLFEHFATAHLRIHHSQFGTAHDAATARRGEAFWPYLARNLPAQFAAAWRSERARVARRSPGVRRILGNRVVQGLLLEAAMLAMVAAAFGARGIALVLVNAAAVILMINVVNYIQHWGISRDGAVRAAHSWDAVGRSNQFSMIGMARHADHHLHPSRPYHLLRCVEGSPKLPRAYGSMIWLAITDNARFQRLMTEALQQSRLRTGFRTAAGTARSSAFAR